MHVTNHRVYQNLVNRKELFVKKVLQALPHSHPYPFVVVGVVVVVVVFFFFAYIFLRLPHDLNACNRLWKTR